MKISIRQISERTGFSPATVSNALNNKRGVNRETADQILKAAREMGYLGSERVENIRLVSYKKHGMILSDTPFFSTLIEGIEQECRQCGYRFLITNLQAWREDFQQTLQEILTDPTSAILLLATELSEEDAKPFENAAAPVVLIDCWMENLDFDSVLISNTDSVCRAVEYLIRNGHREIGHLKSTIEIQNFKYRDIGFRRALERAQLPRREGFTVPILPTMEGAYRSMAEYLSAAPLLPTAYFADNDIIALGALKALQEHGVRVPEQVSIIGFDDMPFCEISSPALTTVRVFKQEMGAMAVRRLAETLHADSGNTNGNIKVKIQICTAFVERESVCPHGIQKP